jgi:RNA polymerase sigma factor (sigma-70 family)
MVSVLEARARELDDESKNITESARRIAEELQAKESTIQALISAKRNGFSTHCVYLEYLARQKINPETGKNFKSVGERQDYFARLQGAKDRFEKQAKNQGCKDWNEYARRLKIRRGFLSGFEYGEYLRNKQDGKEKPTDYIQRKESEKFFAKGLTTAAAEKLDRNPAESRDFITESERNRTLAIKAMESLDEKERKVIERRYLSNGEEAILWQLGIPLDKTLEGIGNEMRLSRERIRQIEIKALRKMRLYLNKKGLLDN